MSQLGWRSASSARDRIERVQGPFAEGTSTASQDDAPVALWTVARQALENRAVFRVDGEDGGARLTSVLHQCLTGSGPATPCLPIPKACHGPRLRTRNADLRLRRFRATRCRTPRVRSFRAAHPSPSTLPCSSSRAVFAESLRPPRRWRRRTQASSGGPVLPTCRRIAPRARPTISNRPGWSSTIWSVLVPIEPVEPSRRTRRFSVFESLMKDPVGFVVGIGSRVSRDRIPEVAVPQNTGRIRRPGHNTTAKEACATVLAWAMTTRLSMSEPPLEDLERPVDPSSSTPQRA